ncbi:MAG: glycosyltransferase [Verrucomicrobiaceae bacterium]|nr:glycosyltransferase [Verrucomicrobiaceae bacterium]
MSHILLLPVGSAGDVFPFIWLGRQLIARGHRVTMVTASVFEQEARAAGLDFVGLGTREEFQAVQRDARIWKPYHATRMVFDYAGRKTALGRDAIITVAARERPALMIGSLLAFGGRLAREQLGIPLVSVHLQPSVIISMYDTPVLFSGTAWLAKLPRWMKRLLFSLPNPADRCAGPWITKACAEAGVRAPRSVFRQWWHSPDGVLLLFPEWFAAPQPDWPADRFQHTFPLEDLAAEQPLSPELQHFLASGEKPIVFTPGSANIQAHRFFDSAFKAVTRLGRRAVFVTRDLSQLPTQLPAAIMAAEYAPFSALVRHAAAFVHHGGVGTLAQGLAAGVPQLLMPMAHDQPDNENRLRRLGAGFGIVPGKFTPGRVAAALAKLTTDAAIARAVRDCSERLAGNDDAGAMIRWIEARARPGA